jgi:hypothetical protein
MTPPLAHVAGMPVEETLPTLAPAAGALLLGARLAVTRIGRRLRKARPARAPTTRSGTRRERAHVARAITVLDTRPPQPRTGSGDATARCGRPGPGTRGRRIDCEDTLVARGASGSALTRRPGNPSLAHDNRQAQARCRGAAGGHAHGVRRWRAGGPYRARACRRDPLPVSRRRPVERVGSAGLQRACRALGLGAQHATDDPA